MKKRQGFVSNSSSSSFVLYGVDQKTLFMQAFPGVAVMQIEALISRFKKLAEAEKELVEWFTKDNSYEWEFLIEPYIHSSNAQQTVEDLEAVYKDNPQTYITGPVDRDDAFERNIMFDVFMGDL